MSQPVLQESFDFAFFWKGRQETLRQCVRRLSKFMNFARTVSPLFDSWYTREKTGGIGEKIAFPLRGITKSLGKGVYHNCDRQVIPELGWSLYLYSGDTSGVTISLGAHLGAYGNHVKNSIIFSVPFLRREASRFLRIPKVREIVGAVVESFEPDHGGVFSELYRRREYSGSRYPCPEVGWITCLGPKYCQIMNCALPAEVEFLPGGSRLIVATAKTFNANDQAHLAAMRTLTDAFVSNGIASRQ